MAGEERAEPCSRDALPTAGWMRPLHTAALGTGNFPFTPCFSSVKLLKIKLCMDSRNAYSERSDGISNYFPQIP